MADDISKWEINLWRRMDISNEDTNAADDAAAGSDTIDRSKYYEEVMRRLNYKYPYKKSSMIHAKLTVTELKKMLGTSLDDEYASHMFKGEIKRRPGFLEGRVKLSAAEAGTAMHLVMQHAPVERQVSADDIRELLDYMTMEEFLTDDQKSSVDIKKIVRFYESPLGLRLLKSSCIKREVPFYMEIDGSEVYSDLSDDIYKGEKVILQGVIDCYFEEDDGLVLVDYKTDYVPDNNIDIIRERYRVQIDYYARALERLTGKSVKEKYIYLFYNGEIIQF
jgi:ATP-dependent helicase/nuclease subunit A